MPDQHTFEYAVVSNTLGRADSKLLLDVHLPTREAWAALDGDARHTLPLIVWYHGGGLIQGSRSSMPPHMRRAVDELGVCVVAPDYRLCPQVRLPDVLSDCHAAVAYTKGQLPLELKKLAPHLPPLASVPLLSGSSAGGYLALLLGLPLSLPNLAHVSCLAIAAIYPITDMDAAFFTQPAAEPFKGRVEEKPELYRPFEDPEAGVSTATVGTPEEDPRNRFYTWAQQKASWQQLLFSPEQLSDSWAQRTSIASALASLPEKDVGTIPPVFLTHGSKDLAVDVEQSRAVVEVLQRKGTQVDYDERKDLDHVFDASPSEFMQPYWNFVSAKIDIRTPSASRASRLA